MKRKPIVNPLYKGLSIGNILPTIANYNGIKTADGVKRYPLEKDVEDKFLKILEGAERIVILEVDALGYDLLDRVKKKFGFLKEVVKISSVFPTCTHTAFASFLTGTSPQNHGVIAGTFRKEGVIDWVGNLSKSDKLSQNLITCESLLQNFNKQGKKVVSLLYDVNDDNFSRYLYPNPFFISSQSSATNLVDQAKEIDRRFFDKMEAIASGDFYLLSSYFWFLDGISGEYGKFSPKTLGYLEWFLQEVGKLREKFPKKTLFLIMGDHGHTSLRKTVIIDQEAIRKINQQSGSQLALDGRLAMFYSQKPNLTRKLFNKEAGNFVEEISRDDYFRLIGGRGKNEERIGDLIFLAKPHGTLRMKPKKKKATHGGLSREEMETVLGFFTN